MKSYRLFMITAMLILFGVLGFISLTSLTLAAPRGEEGSVDAVPDLIVEDIIIDPPTPGAGETASIRPVIKNVGNAAAPGFTIHLYLDPTETPPITTTAAINQTFFGIGLGASETFDGWSIQNQLFAKADWTVCAWVDRGGNIAESNEANNILCVSSPLVDAADDYEPDNLCADAKEIGKNQTPQARNLFRANDTDDIDWVKFTAKSGARYVAEAIPISEGLNLSMELHNVCNGPPSFGAGAKVSFTAPADGTYYLKISSATPHNGDESDYTLKLEAEETCSVLLEPNDICTIPNEISVGAGAQSDSFCQVDDLDWSRFEVRAGGQYTVEVKNLGSRANAQVSRYNSCQGEVVESDDLMTFTASTPGYIYLKAQNEDGNIHGPGTDYTIEVTGSGGCDTDVLEPDNAPAAAQPMSIDGNPLRHNICPSADQDWVRFTAAAGVTYTVETFNLGLDADTLLCQFNAAGEMIRCDDDGGPGLGSRLIIENADAGQYLFRIKDNDPEVAGARTQYDVQVITGLCKKDGHEPNNHLAAAKMIAPNGTAQIHNICDRGDEDWAMFDATANTSYVISTSVLGANADPEITLFNAIGDELAFNDDYTPSTSALITHTFAQAGRYYVRVRHFNPQQYGTGTEYSLAVRPGTITPTPTPTPSTPPVNPPGVDAQQTGARTLILVNRARLVQLFGETSTAALMSKLNQLAAHSIVRGEIIRLDNNANVSAAYANWTNSPANLTNVDRANQVAAEIRRVIMTYLNEREGIEYVVLVGDDQALPFRRIADQTTKQPENSYLDVDVTHPTGAAIRANYYLTDDYFVDKIPTPHQNREIYIPDLAIGRLIETPADMIGLIDTFLAGPVTTVENMLVTGYDFVQDTANADCKDWRTALHDDNKVTCLIGNSWTTAQFQNLQFRQNAPFKVQSINGHAAHYAQGAAIGSSTNATQIAAAGMDLSGGLIYTLACHSGLNVPATNSIGSLDLAEAFARKRANYVGNSGYGWGLLNSIGLSEKVIRLFTKELHRGEQVSMGKALMRAKNLYLEQDQVISVFDEKVLQQFIFYGLPMFEIRTQSALSLGSEFPGVGFSFNDAAALGDDVFTRTLSIDFNRILDPNDQIGNLDSFSTDSGQYLALFDTVSADVGEPVQPLHFGNITVRDTNATARSALLLSATISKTVDSFDPLIGTPVNEYVPRATGDEERLAVGGWYPALPTAVRTVNDKSTLVTQLGQFNADSDELRLFSDFDVEVYFSASSDQTPPEILVVDGLYDAVARTVNVKVGVVDPSGIKEVVVSFIEDQRRSTAAIQSRKLSFDPGSQKWQGTFPGGANSVFFIQAVDNAGNMATAVNKGEYYTPAQARESSAAIYLPMVWR